MKNLDDLVVARDYYSRFSAEREKLLIRKVYACAITIQTEKLEKLCFLMRQKKSLVRI